MEQPISVLQMVTNPNMAKQMAKKKKKKNPGDGGPRDWQAFLYFEISQLNEFYVFLNMKSATG
jgi:hypothetical protein